MPSVTQLRLKLGLEPGQLASGVHVVSLWTKWKGQHERGHTEVGSSEVDRPLLLWVSGGQGVMKQLASFGGVHTSRHNPKAGGWGEHGGEGHDGHACLDMYIQGTHREHNKLKVFLTSETQR